MTLLQSRTRRWLLLLAALGVGACHDALSPRDIKAPPSPSSEISDGVHGGGNQDVFFLPPMVATPVGQPGYGDAFDAGLQSEVSIVVVCKSPAQPPYPTSACKGTVFSPSMVKMSVTDGQYMVNWDTKADGVDPGDTFTIEVHVGSKKIAWADVFLVGNGSAKNVATSDDIVLPDGRTLPIKVRIEQGWDCENNNSCVTQLVSATATTPTLVTTNDGRAAALFPPGTLPPGVDQVLVTIEDVTPNLTSGEACKNPTGPVLTSMVISPQCFKFTTDPKITFQQPVTVATCVDVVPERATSDPLYHTEQLIKYDVGEQTTFLRNVAPPITCPPENPTTIGSRSSNQILNYALVAFARVGHAVGNLFTPKSAYALHLGVGGLIDGGGGFSYITAGFPITESMSSGDGQTGVIGMPLPQPFKVLVTSEHFTSAPVPNEPVRCDVALGAGSFGKLGTSFVVSTGPDGIATCPILTLGPTVGANTVTATALNIDNGVVAAEGTTQDPSSTTLQGVVTFTAQAAQSLTLVDCALSPIGGDELSRGFYIPQFPGSAFSQVNMQFSAEIAGSYTLQLTAHSGTFDGPTLGTSQTTVSLAPGQFTTGSFFFPTPTVVGGSTVTFAMNVVNQPQGAQRTFFGVADTFAGVPSCPVIETEDTTAPLSTFRRQGVAIQVIQSAPVEIQ